MIDGIDKSLRFQANALGLRAERQQVLSSNIANADTPNFHAADFDFARALHRATASSSLRGAANNERLGAARATEIVSRPGRSALDGNSVDMDFERAQFIDNAVRYEAAVKFLNGKIRALLSAIQG